VANIDDFKRTMTAEIRAAAQNAHPIGDFPISESETMQFKHRFVYDAQGKSAAKLLSHAACLAGVDVRSILDFPCGHGRIMRAFRAGWPDCRILACDLDRRGVDFCAKTFNAEPLYSDVDLSKVALKEQVDVVWIGSLLNHLDKDEWPAVFDFAERSLREGGLLLATYAGALVAELVRHDGHQAIPPDEIERALGDYERTGFGFMQYPSHGRKYGWAISSTGWVNDFLDTRKCLRPLMHFERGWAGRQTVLGVVKDTLFAPIR
jgi:SAM-dependent methyltransferase